MENHEEYSGDDGDDDESNHSDSNQNSIAPIESTSGESTSGEPIRKKRRGKRKYKTLFCSSCWRDEGHIPLVKSVPVIVFLTILTLGTYLLFRTYKCRLCGNERMASGE